MSELLKKFLKKFKERFPEAEGLEREIIPLEKEEVRIKKKTKK